MLANHFPYESFPFPHPHSPLILLCTTASVTVHGGSCHCARWLLSLFTAQFWRHINIVLPPFEHSFGDRSFQYGAKTTAYPVRGRCLHSSRKVLT